MRRSFQFIFSVVCSCFFVAIAVGQDALPRGDANNKSLLQRFDTNGDGQIDETERRAVREKMKQMQNRPGAMTPSDKAETIGNRVITEMQFPSSDGKLISCVLSMPQGNGPFPILVTIHGGQGNRDFGYIRSMAAPNGLSPTISAFNEQPWAILAISYRAGNGALFGMEQDDVVAGIRYAKSLPMIDANRVGVVGGSHGGHLALVAAEKMGREFSCVAVGSPWMTDPVVYMTGDPTKPPLSKVPEKAREELQLNGRRILNGMKMGRRMSDDQIREFIQQHSIEANSDKIMIPTLFLTSRGDDQAPHVLIEPMIERMKTAKKEVEVYTAEKSPHGFYWARTVSAARDLRGEKTTQEAEEELIARKTMIEFFSKHFARQDAQTDPSPYSGKKADGTDTDSTPAKDSARKPKPDEEMADDTAEKSDTGSSDDSIASQPSAGRPSRGGGASGSALSGSGMQRGRALGGGLGGTDFESIAGDTGKITRDAFKKQFNGSAILSSRPELADRLFDRLDSDGNGSLNKTEYEGMKDLKSQFGRGGQTGSANPTGRGTNRNGRSENNSSTTDNKSADKIETPANSTSNRNSNLTSKITEPIEIQTGSLVGEQFGDVRIFRGVPYAAAPVGEQRWQAAGAPKPWKGVRQAMQFGAPALQGEAFAPRNTQSEDCLFLNVWTPTTATADSKLPVLFWIHGGAFIQGSGAQPRYDGSELAKRGAVVISINYRLGPLGLFAHPTLTAEVKPNQPLGNYCLLDMIAALRWTRNNIAAFGGDPANVTISGSSAGGTSCLFLMGIPEAQELFHKAIIHSSGGIQNIQNLSEAEAAGVRLAEHLDLGPQATLADLRRVAADRVAVGVGAIRELNLPVKPIIDGRLVKAPPADTFAQGKQAKIPVLIGSANGESGARQFGDEVATGGAFGFQRKLADDMVRAGQSVWMFQLTYVPPQARSSRSAAMHGESVAYAFGNIGKSLAEQYGFRNQQVADNAARSRRGGGNRPAGGGREDDSQPVEDSEQGRAISEAMMQYWVSFMRDGKPSGRNLPPWANHTPTDPKTIVFGNEGISLK
jgi:para-nitrobenzyl esterase